MLHKKYIGIVISRIENNTIKVLNKKYLKHFKYKKIIIKKKIYIVHDTYNNCNILDKIIFKLSKSYSKFKKYIVLYLLK